jgi:hypothetical protein
MIRDKRVVDFLINEALQHPEFDYQTFPSLLGLAGRPPALYDETWAAYTRQPPKDDKAKRAAYIEIWRNYWKEVRDKAELRRDVPLPL